MTTTDNDLGRIMEAAEAEERAAVLDAINEMELINSQLRPLEARKRLLNERIKQYMALQDLTELSDGETGVVARIQDRAGTPLYDLVSAPAETMFHAKAAGMLRLDHAMLERFRKQNGAAWADDLMRFQMPGNGTTALTVEKSK